MPVLRPVIVRKSLTLFVVVLVASLLISGFSSGWAMGSLAWPVAMSAGVSAFSAWQMANQIRKGFVAGIVEPFRLVPIDPAQWPAADWAAIDAHSAYLESMGHHRLGDFTSNASQGAARGFARYFSDAEGTRIVEVQHFERVSMPAGMMEDAHFTVRVSMMSVVGGRIRVVTSNRPTHPAFYLMRSDEVVQASYPALALPELLAKQARLLEFVSERTGKPADTGFTLERYVGLERERFADVKARVAKTSGWDFVREWDKFVEDPKSSWAPGESLLRALPARGWDVADTLAAGGAAETAEAPVDPALRERARSGAHWFYWVSALSLVNAVSSAMGSTWGFIIGLGATQVVSAAALAAAGDGAETVRLLAWVGLAINIVVIAVFTLIGWLATRPSVIAFGIGIALFALDTLIFLLAGDWVGLAFHALALYFMGTGMQAARAMRRAASAAPAPA
ncbi:hypothetical protein BWI17_05880 [Betaproteobacteria bacterium GR16-43]|nr:hypothetical protein BWI17_05880 [Betaproteobacteria bacterium GR16-43]